MFIGPLIAQEAPEEGACYDLDEEHLYSSNTTTNDFCNLCEEGSCTGHSNMSRRNFL